MRTALERLAAFKVDSSFLSRDPKCPLSFSCVTEEIRRAQEGAVSAFAKGQRNAWSPLGMDGRPLRKWVLLYVIAAVELIVSTVTDFLREATTGSRTGRTDTVILVRLHWVL